MSASVQARYGSARKPWQGLKAKLGGSRNETRARARDRCRACRGSTGGGIARRARLGHHARRRDEDERPRQRAVPPAAAPDALTISVDPSRRYQTMEGFGASITDSSAHVLSRLDRRARNAAMREPVPPTNRLSFLRQPIGRLGLRRRAALHLRRPAGRPDRLPDAALLDRARPRGDPAAAAPGARAQPADQGDRLALEPAGLDEDEPVADRRPADRLAADLRRLRALPREVRQGLPSARASRSTRSRSRTSRRTATRTAIPAWTSRSRRQAKLIEALGPALKRARLRTKILGYDHNWSMHQGDIDSTPPGEEPETEYPTDLLRSRAARWIDGTAFHCYAGDPSRQTELQRAFPRQGNLVHRVLGLARPDRPAGAGLRRHAEVARAQPRSSASRATGARRS